MVNKKTKKAYSKQTILAVMFLAVVMIIALGGLVPVDTAHPGACSGETKRFSILAGESKQFSEIKQREVEKNRTRGAGIQMGCSAGTNAELYIF